MSKAIYIYVLRHPVSLEIKYVGKTTNLKKRLENHIWKAVSFKGSRKVYNWVQSILEIKKKPIIETVEVCNELNWAEREQYWISYYRAAGFDLCNLTDGGESNNGYKATDETKSLQSKKQRERHKFSPATKETKLAIAASLSKPVKCVDDDTVYPSLKLAIASTGVPKSTFHRKLHKGEKINGLTYTWYTNQLKQNQ